MTGKLLGAAVPHGMVVAADSVTELAGIAGKVLVAGSHGGIIAAHYAAKARVRAAIFNDAGVGKDDAGVAGLAWLESLGVAAAAVSHRSARIGDGADTLVRGVISRVNVLARKCGVAPGMACRDAAVRLSATPLLQKEIPEHSEGRYRFMENVWGLDSVGLVVPEDAGRILLIGSHGALHGGRAVSALAVDAAFAAFNDAGGRGWSRLPALDARGIAAVTVDCMSARIGDARSMWESAILSRVNDRAARCGLAPQLSLRAAVERFIAAQKKG